MIGLREIKEANCTQLLFKIHHKLLCYQFDKIEYSIVFGVRSKFPVIKWTGQKTSRNFRLKFRQKQSQLIKTIPPRVH
jgi:hypothetical protein